MLTVFTAIWSSRRFLGGVR